MFERVQKRDVQVADDMGKDHIRRIRSSWCGPAEAFLRWGWAAVSVP
jgi:hypothetical protein